MSDLNQQNLLRDVARKNRRAGFFVLGLVLGMIVLTASSVSLYRLYCKLTGFGGQATQSERASGEILSRKIEVRFNTDVHPDLGWDFKAEQPPLTLAIGREAVISFLAVNHGEKASAGTALYNIDPPAAGKYFHKTQCFCFDYQLIAPKESNHFPVVFYIDPELDKDPQLKDLKIITLSYGFFRAESKELDDALEDFYNGKKSGTKSIRINQ